MGLMRRFKREIRSANGRILAFDIRSGYGSTLAGLFERIARGPVLDSEIREIMDGRPTAGGRAGDEGDERRVEIEAGPTITPSAKAGKFNALVSLHGVAMYDVEYQPYAFSTLRLSQVMGRLASDPSIDQIILDIDTPGGMVTGTQEAADAVWAARKKKPVIGLVNPLCASAGYWIASQCSSIVGVPSADIGSIGVFMCHYDCSVMLQNAGIKPTYIFAGEYKTEGNSSEPLTAEGLAWFQSEVDQTYSDFINAVARGRGVTAQNVLDKFGKGRCFGAPMAKKVGMIDSISTIQGALASWGVPDLAQEANRRRAGEPDAPAAEEPEAEEAAAPAAAVFMTQDGCEPCSFMQVTAPGVMTTYAAQAWPQKIAVAHELISGGANRCILAAGDTVTIAVANGAAVYTKIGETVDEYWICTLEPNSSYEPMPATPDPAAAAVQRPATDADAARKNGAEVHRQRLALLSA